MNGMNRLLKASGAATCGVLLAILGLLAATPTARAVVPGANGRILFARSICTSDTRPCWEVVAADADGSHQQVLAGPYPRSVWDDHFLANWSPDGTTAIFMADFGAGQGIWEVNADGSGLREVFAAPAGTFMDDGPTYTPDGRHIIFTRCCGTETFGYSLWRIDADGTDLTDVTKEAIVNGDSPSDNLPQVSPDGKSIAFHRCFPDTPGCVIALVGMRGNHMRQLTDPSLNAQIPNWSPDGRHLVFFAQGNIWTIKPDGSGMTRLTNDNPAKSASLFPSYSPDGTKIIFAHWLSTGGLDLYTMNPDGSGIRLVTRTPVDEWFPQWAAQ